MDRERNFRQSARIGYRAFRSRRWREAAALAISVFLPLLVVGLALGMLLRYQRVGGWLVPLLALSGLAAGGVCAARFGMRHRLDYPQFLRWIERRLGLAENELVNADEMEARLSSIEDPLSRGLARLTVERGEQRIRGVSFQALAPVLSFKRPALWAGGSLLCGIALFLAAPGAFTGSAGRLVRPGTFDLPPELAIHVEPGNATVERGATVRVRAVLSEATPGASLMHRTAGGAWKALEMAPDTSRAGAGRATDSKGMAFSVSLESVLEPTEYAVTSRRARSETYRLKVIEPLRATGYRKRVEFPAYTGVAPTQELSPDGDLSALIGSRATLTVLPSRPGCRGRLLVTGHDPIALEDLGSDGQSATFPVRESMEYRVELTSRDAVGSHWVSEPFHLDAVPDRPPSFAQLSPDRDVKLPPDMAVQLDLDCQDDFGLTRLDLVYRRNDHEPQRTRISQWSGGREARVLYPWKLDGIALVPGDRISYHLELTDNDVVTGPHTTVGPECLIRFPTLDEIYAGVDEDRQEQVQSAQETLQQQKELSKELEKVQNDFKQDRGMNWERQEQVKDLLSRQEKVADQVDQLAQSLDQSLDRMEQANLFTPEMLDKVQQINQLVQSIQNPDFKQYMQKLQDALQRLDRSAVDQALQKLQLSQQDLERNLDRTIAMLQQLQREEKLDAMIQQAERMLEEQKRINQQLGEKPSDEQTAQQQAADSTDSASQDSLASGGRQNQQGQEDQAGRKQGESPEQKLSPEQASALKEKQEALRKEVARLQKELEELRKEAESQWKELSKQMEQRQSEQQLTAASQNMQNASQSMGSCQKRNSLKFGRQAEQKLRDFTQQMRQAQSAMGGAEQEEITRKLYQISGRLVSLSDEQLRLLKEGPEETTRDLAEGQMRLSDAARKALDDLYDLGRQSRFITPELGSVMGEAVRRLSGSLAAFSSGDRGSGMSEGKASAGALDQTVLALLNANQQMCNSSCSNGSNNPLARMRSLSGQQESLNQDMQDMMGQMQGERLSNSGQSGQDRLTQMAARQEMIRRGLADVQQSMMTQSDVLGRLDDIGKEMEDVVQQMRNHDVDQRILRRQEHILSRLLTAQRSLRKQGEEEQRVSRPGVNPEDRPSPPPVAAGPDPMDALRRGILRGSQDPVPGDYRRLVESYFRTLGEQK